MAVSDHFIDTNIRVFGRLYAALVNYEALSGFLNVTPLNNDVFQILLIFIQKNNHLFLSVFTW